jgi:hypothetical protein
MWSWQEEHDGLAPPEPLDLFWMPVVQATEQLEAGQGQLLPRL